ncbi:MAG: helix-turn-helix domain-containing protein [Alphaproteobacteria bacterium]|nr:helix-turn-helix domain-containing protein [Alphaproteobacteria bacterium]
MAGKPVSQSSKNLGMRMKKILKEVKVSQEKAAFKLGLPYQSSLNHYLSGRSEIPVNLIEKFSHEFKVPLNVLMDSDDLSALGMMCNLEALDIMQAINNYVTENLLFMEIVDKVVITQLFYKEKNNSKERIYAALDAIRQANPTMFKKIKE